MTKRRIPFLKGESISIFRESISSEETWKHYERLFYHFLEWVHETPDSFLERCKKDKDWVTSKIIEYIVVQKERVRRGEISEGSVANCKKPVKLFLDMNDVSLNWKKINQHSAGKAPVCQ